VDGLGLSEESKETGSKFPMKRHHVGAHHGAGEVATEQTEVVGDDVEGKVHVVRIAEAMTKL